MTEDNVEDTNAIEATPVLSQPKASHTRTILEIVGGIVAVGLIFFTGVAGFVLGHVTAKHDGRDERGSTTVRIERGPDSQQPPDLQGGPGFQQGGPGFQQGGPGLQQRQGFQQGGPLQQGTVPSAPIG